jgi:two-component system phosphate regulon sensor histidine kinase PhoR
MAAASTDTRARATPAARYLPQLWRGRWLLAAAVALTLALYAADAVNAFAAILIVAAVAALVARMPPPPEASGAAVEAAPAVGPDDAGIKAFVEALPDPCFILDRRGIVRHANARAAATFPIPPGEALRFRLRVPDVVAAFDRVAAGGPPERVEFVERVPTERWFAAWFGRLEAGDFIVLILDDLSERKRADRVRVDFVANASHELRTPLASLAGFIETLQGPARGDEAARERFLSIMHDQADRMSRLVNDLLSLSRIEMKAHVRPSDRLDAVAVVRHVVDSLEPLARESGVAIEVEAPAGPIEVTGDRDELIQVFENLLENACKYGQSGKRVVVAVSVATSDGDGARVSVRDFGPGIREEHLPRLTERFYRIDVEASRRHRGTGLGLAIVKHILARHRARLSVESTLGEGAAFTVTFPQARAAAAVVPSQKTL